MEVEHWWDKPAPALRWKWDASVHLRSDVLPACPSTPPLNWPIPRVGDRVDSGGEEYEVVAVIWNYDYPTIEVYLK